MAVKIKKHAFKTDLSICNLFLILVFLTSGYDLGPGTVRLRGMKKKKKAINP